jgi:hypothetical protein
LQETKIRKPIKDDDDFVFKDFVDIPNFVKITEKGIAALIELSQKIEICPEINSLVKELIEIKRFDTVVREASLLLETSIKYFHKTDLFGQNLIDLHIKDVIRHNDEFNVAVIKHYRSELRSIFKFIRNDYAHNFRILSEEHRFNYFAN